MQNSVKQVTLQEIADSTGVSRATVSLALRDCDSIPETTRVRIKKAAEELGYRPNPLVSALMTYHRSAKPSGDRTVPLAMLFDFSRDDCWQRFFSPNLVRGVAERAAQYGYKIEEFWMRESELTGKRLSQILYHRNISGLLIAPLPVPYGHLRLDWWKFSAVGIGYSLSQPVLHRVTTERYHGLLLALKKLRKQGYRRIGLALHTNEDSRVHHLWVGAYLWDQQRLPPSWRVPMLVESVENWTEKNFASWYKRYQPEVVMGTTKDSYVWLQKLGCRIPEEVGFVHLWNPDTSGKFAGVYHNDFAIGKAGVDFLVCMLQRNERGLPAGRQTVVLGTDWVDGATLPARQIGPREVVADFSGENSYSSAINRFNRLEMAVAT